MGCAKERVSDAHPRIRLSPHRAFCSWLLPAVLSMGLLLPGVALRPPLRALCLMTWRPKFLEESSRSAEGTVAPGKQTAIEIAKRGEQPAVCPLGLKASLWPLHTGESAQCHRQVREGPASMARS